MNKIELKKQVKNLLIKVLQWTIIFISWVLFIAVIISPFYFPYAIIIAPFVITFLFVWILINHMRFNKKSHQSIIIFGGRGKGKGLLFQKAINSEDKALCNIPYGDNTIITDPDTYFDSIRPNDFQNAISGTIIKSKKVTEWEKVPYYLDDTAVYFPNTEDTFLKKHFKSLSLFITIQRHLYDTYTVLNAQNILRVYKNLRELQLDGYIKARRTIGKTYIWRHLPILRHYFIVQWRFYENIDSADNGLLPFEKMGIINRGTDLLYTSSAAAQKEVYKGEHGEILDGFIFINRKHIHYDTRYYSTLFFTDDNDTTLINPDSGKETV